MTNQTNLSAEQEVRKSIIHRFITENGIGQQTIDSVVNPLVNYIISGDTKNNATTIVSAQTP